MKVAIIVAVSENGVIGNDNKLIWHLPLDLKHFKSMTDGHHVIMGRKTFDSIRKPLPNRTNIVISRQADLEIEGCLVAGSLSEALSMVKNDDLPFICGGAAIYKEALNIADYLYLTRVHASFEGDTHFPEFDETVWIEKNRLDVEPDAKNKYPFSIITYERERTP
ncbi:MAG: dihydrofolate reductase [Flavobacteriales bacterium]|nr:dihydrofolate reductase [Flavobacteriales bacterium]